METKITFLEEFKSATPYYHYDIPYYHYYDDPYEGYYGDGDYDDLFDTISNGSTPTDSSPGLLHVPSNLETMLQDQSSRPHDIPLQHLKDITGNFSDERILGKGGSGVVYKVINHFSYAVVIFGTQDSKTHIQNSKTETFN
jgi:hypothetical protein